MQGIEQHRDTTGWRLAAAGVFLVLLLHTGAARANDGVEVRSASTLLQAGVWYLDADIDYTLNETVREALDSGLVLDIELTIRLTQRRPIIWDPLFAELRQRYELQFHALTERYILRNLNSGEQSTFGTLPAALAAVGRVRSLPIIDDALLDRGEPYRVSIRAVVDIKQLGGPLALISLLWDDWRISSDTVRWRLAR